MVKRRHFLGSSLILAGGLFAGCGSSDSFPLSSAGSTGSATVPPTGNFQGRVNLSEVGGSGLSVLSAFADPGGVDTGGQFSTVVSQEFAQLLISVDSAGAARALGLSLPGQNSPLNGQLGALSSALLLCFMTGGILSSDPQEALQRLEKIQALGSFQALSDFVRLRLPNLSLAQIVQSAGFPALLQAVVDDWAARHLIQPKINPVEPSILNAYIGLNYSEDEPTPESNLNIANSKFRYVSLVRQNLGANDEFIDSPYRPVIQNVANSPNERNLLPPAIALSFGDLLTLQVGQPTEGFEPVNLAEKPSVQSVGYYVYGPGLPSLGLETFSEDIETLLRDSRAFSFSVLFLGLGPVLNLFAPLSRNFSDFGKQLFEGFSNGIAGGLDSSSLILAYSGGNRTDIIGAWSNFLLTAAGLGAALMSGPLAAAATVITSTLVATGVGFGLANLSLFVDTTTKLPMRQVVKIQAPGSTGLQKVATLPLSANDIPHQVVTNGAVLLSRFNGESEIGILELDGSFSKLVSDTANGASTSGYPAACVSTDLKLLAYGKTGGVAYKLLDVDGEIKLSSLPPSQSTVFSNAVPTYYTGGILEGEGGPWILCYATGYDSVQGNVMAAWLLNSQTEEIIDLDLSGLPRLNGIGSVRLPFLSMSSNGWLFGQYSQKLFYEDGSGIYIDGGGQYTAYISPASADPITKIAPVTNYRTILSYFGTFQHNRFGCYTSFGIVETFDDLSKLWRLTFNRSGDAQLDPDPTQSSTRQELLDPTRSISSLTLDDSNGLLTIRQYSEYLANSSSATVTFQDTTQNSEVDVTYLFGSSENRPITALGGRNFFAVTVESPNSEPIRSLYILRHGNG